MSTPRPRASLLVCFVVLALALGWAVGAGSALAAGTPSASGSPRAPARRVGVRDGHRHRDRHGHEHRRRRDAGARHLADDAAGRLPAERQPGAGDRLAQPGRQGRAAPPSARGRLRVHEGLPGMAGQLVLRSEARAGVAPGLRRRPDRRGHPDLDRLSGRLDDGPRLPRRVRPQRQRLVHLDPAVHPVRGALLPLAPAADAAASRSADAARVLDLAGVLQPRQDRALGPARLPVPAVSAGAHAGARARQGRPARTAANRRPDPLAGRRDRVPDGVPDRAQRAQLERDRRRLRRRDRRDEAAPRAAAVRPLAGRQRLRRHLRPGVLLLLRPVPADLRLERHLGLAARVTRRGDLLRREHARGPVSDRPQVERQRARDPARLRLGCVSVHAVHAQLQHERRARRRDGHLRAAGDHLGARRAACSPRSPA